MFYKILKEDGYALLKEDGYAILLEIIHLEFAENIELTDSISKLRIRLVARVLDKLRLLGSERNLPPH